MAVFGSGHGFFIQKPLTIVRRVGGHEIAVRFDQRPLWLRAVNGHHMQFVANFCAKNVEVNRASIGLPHWSISELVRCVDLRKSLTVKIPYPKGREAGLAYHIHGDVGTVRRNSGWSINRGLGEL